MKSLQCIQKKEYQKKQFLKFFGKNNSDSLETFNFILDFLGLEQLNFDNSIRLVLTSFSIHSESQLIERIMDCFSKRFYETHQNQGFASSNSVHLLSYCWLIMHTRIHNSNVLKNHHFLVNFKLQL